MRTAIKTGMCAICLLLATACSKSLLDENPPQLITPDNLYIDKAGFQAGINGLYDEVRRARSGNTYGDPNDLMLVGAFIGVDNAYGNFRAPLEDVFNEWGARNNSLETSFRRVWGWLYETINAANTIIVRAEKPGINWTEDEKNGIVAEARFIRAWAYRHLAYLWGAVPLTLEEAAGTNIKTDWQRAPVAEVQKSMEADWLFAAEHLPETSSANGIVLSGTARHYLAELYLAMNQPAKAKEQAAAVVQNNNYRLVTERYGVQKDKPGTPFTDLFLDGNSNRSEGNTEALWVIQSELNVIGGDGSNIMRRYWVNRYYSLRVGGKNPVQVSAENGGRGIGRLAPTRFALDLYDDGDDRGSAFAWRWYWLVNDPANIPSGYDLGDTIYLARNINEQLSNPGWPNPRKWDYTNPTDANDARQYNDQIYVRSAETWLLLAEAELKLNNPQGAADAVNVLRQRAHVDPVDPGQVNLDLILDERSRELFSEEERRYTLLRTGKWLERTRLHNIIAGPLITPRDTLWPVPQDVIDANITAEMKQNEGY